MRKLQWFFDFISPYAYLQSRKLHEFQGLAEIEYRPVVFAGLLKHWGQLGPVEIPAKRIFTYRQVEFIAARDGIPLRFPPGHPFRSLEALRLVAAQASDPKLIHAIFSYVWEFGQALSDEAGLKRFLEQRGLLTTAPSFPAEEAKRILLSHSEAAIALGVFGVPTLVLDEELFWGSDSSDWVLDCLRKPELLLTLKGRRFTEVKEEVVRKKQL